MSKKMHLLGESKVKNPENYETIIDDNLLNDFEDLIKSKKFTGVSYTTIDSKFKNKFDVDFDNIILLRYYINPDLLCLEPAESKHKLIDDDFKALGKSIYELSDFLRTNGFATEIVNPIDREMDLRECIEKSNAGVIGRSGVCIFSEGPNVVLFGILVSIANFPKIEKNNLEWVKDFCASCGNCIRKCPEDAFDDGLFNRKLCIGYKQGCGLCIVNCPFFIKSYESIKKSYDKRISRLNK